MAIELDRVGKFRGRIVHYSIFEADSGAEAIVITVALDEILHEGEWFDWSDKNMEATGRIWVIKKDGTLNDRQVRAMVDNAGWNGSFAAVADGPMELTPVQVMTEADEYKGEVRYRINWVNAYDAPAAGGGNVSPDDVKTLDAKYGAQMRALAGSAKRNDAPPPAEKPKPPKAAEPVPPKGDPPPDDSIPF